MELRTLRTFSGGLTIEDLREAWKVLPPDGPYGWPVTQRFMADWRRSQQSVTSLFGTLRRIHSGKPKAPGDLSTLWQMTDEERHFVFTGEVPFTETPPPETPAAGTIEDMLAVLRDIRRIMAEAWSVSETI